MVLIKLWWVSAHHGDNVLCVITQLWISRRVGGFSVKWEGHCFPKTIQKRIHSWRNPTSAEIVSKCVNLIDDLPGKQLNQSKINDIYDTYRNIYTDEICRFPKELQSTPCSKNKIQDTMWKSSGMELYYLTGNSVIYRLCLCEHSKMNQQVYCYERKFQ